MLPVLSETVNRREMYLFEPRKVSLAVATNLSYPVLWLTLGVQ